MNRTWLVAAVLAVMVLTAGCGGPNGGPGANETETETEVDVTPIDETPTETPPEASVTTGDVAVPGAPDVAMVLAG